MRKNNRVQGTGYSPPNFEKFGEVSLASLRGRSGPKSKILAEVQGTEKGILADNRILSPEPCPLSPEKGFTLIELMVSASILGMIGLAVLTTFASGFHVYERVQSYGGLQADILLSLEEMERDLSNTFSFSGIGFNGEAQKITFPALIETVELIEGEETAVVSVGWVSYSLDGDGGQKGLVRDEGKYAQAGLKDKNSEGQNSSLTSVKDLTFSYCFLDGEKQEHTWKGSWAAEEGLPEAVKIELTYEDRGGDIPLVRTVFVPAVQIVDPTKEDEDGEEGEEEGGGEV